MEILNRLISIVLLIRAARSLSKCCPLNFELSINATIRAIDENTISRDRILCVSSPSATLSVTYTSSLNVGLTDCVTFRLIDSRDHSQRVACVDRVASLDNVFGLQCDYRQSSTADAVANTFLLPSILSFRKCCPFDRQYDDRRQFCWSEYSTNETSSSSSPLLDVLKIAFKRPDTLVHALFGAPKCRSHEVLVDVVVHYSNTTFQDGQVRITTTTTANKSSHIVATLDEYCADVVDDRFEYIVIRVCRDYRTECRQKGRVCVRKCCPVDQELEGRECVPSKRSLSLSFYDYGSIRGGGSRYGGDGSLKVAAPPPPKTVSELRPAYLQGNRCANGKYLLNENDAVDRHVLTTAGTVFMVAKNKIVDEDEYCVDNLKSKNDTKTFICFRAAETSGSSTTTTTTSIVMKMKFFLTKICVTISAFFLVVTFLIYLFLPPLRNQHGKLIMCYLVTAAASYTTLVAQHFLPFKQLPSEVCNIVGYTMLCTFLSSFCWLNIISYDIWSTFRAVRSSFFKQSKRCKKFSIFCVYGWAYPICWSVATAVCQYTSLVNEFSTWKPDIGKPICWFSDYGMGKVIFFIVPVTTMISFNIVIFVFTVKYCSNIRVELKKSNQNYSFKRFSSDKNELILNAKLFVVMGLNWSMELISLLVQPNNRTFFIVSDLMNALGGVMIFCIFVLKRKVLRALKQKCCCYEDERRRSLERATGFTTSTTSSIFMSIMASRKSINNVP